jgi:hypothetical protein
MKKNILKKIKINNMLASIICGIISYYALCFDSILESFNISSLIILLFIILAFNKYLMINEKKHKYLRILAILFSIITVYGKLCLNNMNERTVNIIREVFREKNIFITIGYYYLYLTTLNYLIPKICNLKLKENKLKNLKSIYVFIISIITMLICWLPYFLSLYPGTLSGDSVGELYSASINKLNTDHHTIMHMLIIRISYLIGKIFTKNIIGAIIIYNVIQVAVVSIIFAYTITFLYKRKTNIKILIGIIIFYSLSPIFGYYSIVMWKDIFFGAFSLLLTIQCYKLIEQENLNLKNSISFIIASLLTIFSRNNAIYMYFLVVLFTFIIQKKNYKKLLIIFILVLGSYYTIKGPIYNFYGISKSSSAEYLAIPMQQIGRMVYKDIKLTKKEEKVLNNILNVKIMRDAYDPRWSDGIKFNKNYNRNYIKSHKKEVFDIWFKMVIKHPLTAIEAYSISTLGYWYPNMQGRAYENSIAINNWNIETMPIGSKVIQKYVAIMGDATIPIIQFIWSIGMFVWLLLLLIYINIIKKNKKILYVFIPTIGVWITLMLATPVYNEVRYIYCLYTTIPFLIALTLNNKNLNKIKN